MKPTFTSFLFFCVSLLIVCHTYGQSTDSLSHYSRLVNNPSNPEDLAKAYKFFTQEKIKHSKNHEHLVNEIHATQYLAQIQNTLGYTAESEKLNLESLMLLEKVQKKTDWTQLSYLRIINELGKIYRERKDYSQALALYDHALKNASRPVHIAILLNNKGQVYEFKKELNNALSNYEAAYSKALEANNSKEISRTLNNLSFIKSELSIAHAEKGLNEALSIRISNKHTYDLGSSYDRLARFYYKINDTIRARQFSTNFMQLANKTGVANQLLNALRLKIETGQSKFALRYITLNDSLNNLKQEQRNNFNYYVYQYDKKEKDLQKSQLFSERLLYLLLFLTLVALSIYFILKYKHKKEKLQEVYNTETRISRKIHDEVANDVYHVMTQLQTGANNNKELLDDLENIYIRTRDISKQNSSIDLKAPYSDLIKDLFLDYKDESVNVVTKDLQLIKWEDLNDIKRSTIYRILQELLTNMRKHSKASIVVLSFKQQGQQLVINYKDNGKGTDLTKGNGLQNAENRIHSINGTITFESELEKGFKAIITI